MFFVKLLVCLYSFCIVSIDFSVMLETFSVGRMEFLLHLLECAIKFSQVKRFSHGTHLFLLGD